MANALTSSLWEYYDVDYIDQPTTTEHSKSILDQLVLLIYLNRPKQAKCVATVINCGLGLQTAMAPSVNRGWNIFSNGKYCNYFSKYNVYQDITK